MPAADPLDAFPLLRDLAPEARERLLAHSRAVVAPTGTVLFRPGEVCSEFVMVRAGSVRVRLLSDTGHEIVLYRVGPGETCVLTTSCLLAHEAYSAEGVAEREIEALLLPLAGFEAMMAASAPFRGFVLHSFGARLAELMHRIEEVAFRPIDERLARWLLARGESAEPIAITHQELAVELGTAREVVSRRLKHLERRGMIGAARGAIALRDREALRRIVAGAGAGLAT